MANRGKQILTVTITGMAIFLCDYKSAVAESTANQGASTSDGFPETWLLSVGAIAIGVLGALWIRRHDHANKIKKQQLQVVLNTSNR